jgi:hypothetical protein
LIVDKNLRFQPLSQCEPWEQWFLHGQVAAWLGDWCTDVRCDELSGGTPPLRPGLFMAWQATRRCSS